MNNRTTVLEIPKGAIKIRITLRPGVSGREVVGHLRRTRMIDDDTLLDTMPLETDKEMDIVLIPWDVISENEHVLNSTIERLLAHIGYKMIGPIATCFLNGSAPSLADRYPNSVIYKDTSGKICQMGFSAGDSMSGPIVYIGSLSDAWQGPGNYFPCVSVE